MKRQTPISLLNRSEMRSATDALEDRLRECSEERKAAEVSPPFLLRLLPSPHPTSSPLPPSMTWNLKACVGGLRQLAQGLPTSENEGRKCEAGPGKSPADKPRPKSSGGEALAGQLGPGHATIIMACSSPPRPLFRPSSPPKLPPAGVPGSKATGEWVLWV